MSTIVVFLLFLALALVIWVTGVSLTKEVDELAETTGIGKGFLGVFLLGLITSLPELLSTSTAGIIGNFDLALGNIYGSNVFNLSMLIWADVFYRDNKSLGFNLSQQTLVTGLSAIFLISLLSIGLIGFSHSVTFYIFGIPLVDWLILISYIIIARQMWGDEKNSAGSIISPKPSQIIRIVFLSMVIVVAGIAISFVCDAIARIKVAGLPLGGTFVGGLLLGMATSLPELSVSISSVRLGSVDMAVGNVFGSNMFNVIIVFFADIFANGSILNSNLTHLVSYATIVLMTSLFVIFSMFRQRRKLFSLSPVSYLLIISYLIWASALYFWR